MSLAIQVESNKAEKTRRLIMDNASRIFLERGFRNVSVEELCRTTGVSKGTFYKYFANREALVEAVLDECFSETELAMVENFRSGKDVEEIFETHYNLCVDLFISRVSARMMADIQSHMPQLWKRLVTMRRDEVKQLIKLFKRGQSEGRIRKNIDIVTMSKLFEEIMANILRPDFLMSQDLTLNQVVATLISTILYGIIEKNE